MPTAKWVAPRSTARDRPFPENVFNSEWTPFLPELKPAFAAIAITWELEYPVRRSGQGGDRIHSG